MEGRTRRTLNTEVQRFSTVEQIELSYTPEINTKRLGTPMYTGEEARKLFTCGSGVGTDCLGCLAKGKQGLGFGAH